MDDSVTPAPISAAASAAPLPHLPPPSSAELRLNAELKALPGLDLHELRVRWRKLYRSTAPAHLSKALLVRIIAYKLQANLYGDLDRATVRLLERIARDQVRGAKSVVPPVPERRSLKPGSVLVREHGGVLHKVTVVEGGFTWGEATYKSLSEVARAITGTNWNGPRFFGLRDRTPDPATRKGGRR